MSPIEIRGSSFRPQVVVIRWQRKSPGGVVRRMRENVLGVRFQELSRASLQRDGQGLASLGCGRLDLIDVQEARVRPQAGGGQWRVDVARAKQVRSTQDRVLRRDQVPPRQLVLDANAYLRHLGRSKVGGHAYGAGQ